jgi:hypothetical protein
VPHNPALQAVRSLLQPSQCPTTALQAVRSLLQPSQCPTTALQAVRSLLQPSQPPSHKKVPRSAFLDEPAGIDLDVGNSRATGADEPIDVNPINGRTPPSQPYVMAAEQHEATVATFLSDHAETIRAAARHYARRCGVPPSDWDDVAQLVLLAVYNAFLAETFPPPNIDAERAIRTIAKSTAATYAISPQRTGVGGLSAALRRKRALRKLTQAMPDATPTERVAALNARLRPDRDGMATMADFDTAAPTPTADELAQPITNSAEDEYISLTYPDERRANALRRLAALLPSDVGELASRRADFLSGDDAHGLSHDELRSLETALRKLATKHGVTYRKRHTQATKRADRAAYMREYRQRRQSRRSA